MLNWCLRLYILSLGSLQHHFIITMKEEEYYMLNHTGLIVR